MLWREVVDGAPNHPEFKWYNVCMHYTVTRVGAIVCTIRVQTDPRPHMHVGGPHKNQGIDYRVYLYFESALFATAFLIM